MKKILLLSSFVISVMLLFSSCEKIKELTDIPIDADLNADISTISEHASSSAGLKGATAQEYSFSGTATINPTDNEDIDKYWKKIREWEVKKVVVKVKNASKEAVLLNGQLVIKDKSTDEILFVEDVENVQLKSGTIVFSISGADWGEVISALNSKHSLVVGINGALDEPGVSITYGVVISLKVTANIFN
jgi:hypothetical protein